MTKPLSGRVILRALLPAFALVFFVLDAVRNPDRVIFSSVCALLAGLVLVSRLKWGGRRG